MNNISQIHYAVEIDTLTTLTNEVIGLYQGKIRFTTDGYVPTNATYENGDAVPTPTKWFTKFLSKEAIQGVGSKIDIVVGGDYSYLQNAVVELANYTTTGDRYHTELFNTLGVFITGAKFKIYVILNDVYYVRWSGVVSGTTFSDDKFQFSGSDSHNNNNDTLSNVILGYVIGSKYTYSEVEALPYKRNLALRRYGPYEYGIPHIHHVPIEGAESTASGHSLGMFNGFANSSLGDTQPVGPKWLQIEYSSMAMDFMNNEVEIGDLININGGSTYYEILGWDEEHGAGSQNYQIRIYVQIFDDTMVDYKACFGYPQEFKDDTPVYESLSQMSTDKALLSFYKKADGTGIPASVIQGDYVTIIDSDGNSIKMTYTVLPNGTIRLDNEVYTASVTPTSIKLFKSPYPLNYYTGGDSFLFPEDNDWTDLTLPNSMNVDDYFVDISGIQHTYSESSNGLQSAMFKLTFPEDILDSDTTWSIGTMVKGIFEDQNLNWQLANPGGTSQPNTGIGWYRNTETANWVGSTTPVGTSQGISFGDAKHLAGARFNNFSVKVCRIAKAFVDGKEIEVPFVVDEFYLPNCVTTTSVNSQNIWDRLNVKVKSIISTNTVNPDERIHSTPLGIRWFKSYPTTIGFTGNYTSHYIQNGMIDFKGEDVEISETEILICIEGLDNDLNSDSPDGAGGGKTIYHTSNTGVNTEYISNISDPVPFLHFKINGFTLFTTQILNEKKNELNIISNDVDTNTYPNLLKEIANESIDDTYLVGRDNWISGIQVVDPTPRFNLITDMCKQGFVAGFTARNGVPTFTTFLESTKPYHYHDDNLIIDKSIKQFTSTPISKIYNEFNIKWNYNYATSKFGRDAIIKNVKETQFPQITENWKEYVSGIPDYNLSQYYWDKASLAYKLSQVINKAPSDRTDLKFAYDNVDPDAIENATYLDTVTNSIVISENLGDDITTGALIKFPYMSLPNNFLKVNDIVYLSDNVNTMRCIIMDDIVQSSTPQWICRVVSTDFPTATTITIDAQYSYVLDIEDTLIAGERYETPPASSLNGEEVQNIIDDAIVVGSFVKGLKSSFGSDVIVGDICRLIYIDNLTMNYSFMDVKIISYLPTNNTYWYCEVIKLQNLSQYASNIFEFTKAASWTHKIYTTDLEFKPENISGYAYEYIKNLLNWTTYQKFQCNYDLPINSDTLKYEIMDPVHFSDQIIVPAPTYGKGWITSLTLDSKKDLLKCQITFSPEFLMLAPVVQCQWIDEKSTNTDIIDEKSTNTDFINEKVCYDNN